IWFPVRPRQPRPRRASSRCPCRSSTSVRARVCRSFPRRISRMSNNPVHLVDLLGIERAWALRVFDEAERLRAARGTKAAPRPLQGRTAALIFHKPSLRTRVSFTVGMHDLGGDVVDLTAAEVAESGREGLRDVAQVLSTMCSL